MNDATSPALLQAAEQALSPAAPSPIPVDRIAELYNGEIFTRETAESARQRIHWMCGQAQGSSALDVGCSQGITTVLLAREGVKVTGLDSHPEAMAYARELSARETAAVQSRIKWIEGDFWDLPVAEKFDTVILGEVIEHQAAPARFLAKAVQHVAPAGRIVLTTPFGLHPHEDHKVSLLPSDLSRMAEDCGLRVVDLDVTDGYMRTVLALTAEGGAAVPGPAALLGLTEKGTLASQGRLFRQLDDYRGKLRKKDETAKILQKRLEAAEKNASSLTDANKARAAEISQLLKSNADQLAEVRRELAGARTRASELEAELARASRSHAKQIDDLAKEHRNQIAKLQAQLQAAPNEKDRAAELAQLERTYTEEIDALRKKHQNTVAALYQAGVAERTAAEARVKSHLSYRWGQVLLSLRDHRLRALTLPWHLYRAFQEFRAGQHIDVIDAQGAAPRLTARDIARAARNGGSVPVQAAEGTAKQRSQLPPSSERESWPALADAQGVEAVIARIDASTAGAQPRARADALVKASQAFDAPGSEATAYRLVQAAVGHCRDEAMLRALFWAAQKAHRFVEASELILEIEALAGPRPSAIVQERLVKLRKSPSNQLRVLKQIPAPAAPRIQSVPSRVCYILHNSLPYSSGGYATRSHGVAGGLSRAGYEVFVLTRPGFPLDSKPGLQRGEVAPVDEIDGIRYLRTLDPVRKGMTYPDYVEQAAAALEAQFRKLRPELVVAASNHVTAMPALIAARKLGLPFVYEVRGFWEVTRQSRDAEYEQTPVYAVQLLLEGAVAAQADHVFTLTEPMREELVKRGAEPGKIDLLPNSCDPNRFLPRPRDEALAARLGIPAGVPVIGYVGTFVDYEGLEDLVAACVLLKKRGVTFRLLMVGNENTSGQERGPITEEIGRIAAEGGLSDWLIMTGRVPHEEVESYYSLIEVCPFPRKPWPVCEMVSPMKPLEALAMEKAVVVSSVRALVEMIKDGQTGLVFEKGSIGSLADKLEELTHRPELRQRLGANGRAWVGAERTWEQVGLKFRQRMKREAPARGQADTAEAAVAARVAAGEATPVAPAAEFPQWWNEIDASLRDRCGYVDVRDWRLSPSAEKLRDLYVGRFDPAQVRARIPATNWARADICVKMVGRCASLLDVGSGLGEFVNLAALDPGQGKITSVDLKDWDLWFDATGKLERVYKNIMELDQSHARDVVTCFEVIEHLPPDKVAQAVGVLRSLAKRKLFVSVPFMEPLPLYRGHYTRFDAGKLLELFPDARFTVFGKGGDTEIRAWIMCEIDAKA